jgi:hypothetical protein
MLEPWDPGKIAMCVCWAAFALTGYVAAAGAPVQGVNATVLVIALLGLSGIAAGIAVERGYRVGDGIAASLILGALVGWGRRAAKARLGDDKDGDAGGRS